MVKKQSISIIIPYYNSYSTLERALESTITDVMDVEIIIIDDNSRDDCSSIINKLKDRVNIKCIRNEKNLGAGVSRNRGIKEATKKYITFLDSDDEFTDLFFQKIEPVMLEDCDEIVYDALVYKFNKINPLKMFFSRTITPGYVNSKDALVFLRGCTWGKIYKTDIIKQNNVEFGNIPRAEDEIFNAIATSFANTIYYISDPLYIYHFNSSSITNTCQVNPQNHIIAYEIIRNRLKNRNLDIELNNILFFTLYSITTNNIALKKSFREINATYTKYRRNYDIKDPYRKRCSFKFKISFFMFELKLFRLYGWLFSTMSLLESKIYIPFFH